MKNIIRSGALTLALIADVALVTAPPAEARSIQRDGYFGGTWSPIGPRHNHYVQRYYRRHGPNFYAYAGPGYGYEPDYYYGPGYYYRPGLGFGLSFY